MHGNPGDMAGKAEFKLATTLAHGFPKMGSGSSGSLSWRLSAPRDHVLKDVAEAVAITLLLTRHQESEKVLPYLIGQVIK